jgi:hypothetical protein
MRFGFVGPSYQPQSPLADAENTVNLLVERNMSQNARTQWLLLNTPGLAPFAHLVFKAGGTPPSVRGSCVVNGRSFWVAGTHLFEVSGAGAIVDYGGTGTTNNNIIDDGLPAILIPGGTAGGLYPGQLLISSGGSLTAFLLASNTYVAITGAPAQVVMIDYLDGFFVALQSTNDFQVSNVEDCTTWSGLSISQVSVFSDQLVAIVASNRLLWVFGAKRSVSYYTSGLPIFPFSVNSTGFLEVGCSAQFSPSRVALASGTTIMWLGGDERGANIVFALSGYNNTRVSDYGIETWMNQQATTADAVGFATQEYGHNYYWLWFPTANATWRLDADLGFWTRMSSLVNSVGAAHLARCHQFNFGQHLVGDRNSGTIYTMSPQLLTEVGPTGIVSPIIRQRIGPTVSNESSWNPIPINEFQVDVETGLGPQPPLTDFFGRPRDPLMVMNFSEDFGKTWSPDQWFPCGQAGNFEVAAIARRLGSWRSFTAKITMSDPVAWRIVDAYVNATQDSSPRLARSYAKLT